MPELPFACGAPCEFQLPADHNYFYERCWMPPDRIVLHVLIRCKRDLQQPSVALLSRQGLSYQYTHCMLSNIDRKYPVMPHRRPHEHRLVCADYSDVQFKLFVSTMAVSSHRLFAMRRLSRPSMYAG